MDHCHTLSAGRHSKSQNDTDEVKSVNVSCCTLQRNHLQFCKAPNCEREHLEKLGLARLFYRFWMILACGNFEGGSVGMDLYFANRSECIKNPHVFTPCGWACYFANWNSSRIHDVLSFKIAIFSYSIKIQLWSDLTSDSSMPFPGCTVNFKYLIDI